MNLNDKEWIETIWAHQRRQKIDAGRSLTHRMRVSWWTAMRATIAIWLGNWIMDVAKAPDYYDWSEVAWRNMGLYDTDYGVGHAFDTLVVRGFTVLVYADGTL